MNALILFFECARLALGHCFIEAIERGVGCCSACIVRTGENGPANTGRRGLLHSDTLSFGSVGTGVVVTVIVLPECTVREWRADDARSLATHANDRRIWLNLRDAFPHPYTLADAKAFLAVAVAMQPRTWFAITVDGQAVGGIGYTLHGDVERISAEIGYWLGTAFWGRGIMTAALRAVTAYAFRQHAELRRIYAVPYVTSTTSAHVLEKVGYRLEGTMRQSAIKEGNVLDQFMYAILRNEAAVL